MERKYNDNQRVSKVGRQRRKLHTQYYRHRASYPIDFSLEPGIALPRDRQPKVAVINSTKGGLFLKHGTLWFVCRAWFFGIGV